MILSTFLALSLGAASAYDQTFDRGLEAYASGRFEEAADAFEQLVGQNVVDPAVFYNLGNSYYRSGRIGPAIANYERALDLDPSFIEARENLTRCVNDTKHRLSAPAPPDWERGLLFWHDNVSPRVAFITASVAWVIMWTLLAVRRIRPFRFLRRAAVVSGLVAALFGVSMWAKTHPQSLAVASAESVPVRFGTSEKEVVYFELNEGDRVLIDSRVDGWARVVTSEARRGWTRENLLTFVGPPYERAPDLEDSLEEEAE